MTTLRLKLNQPMARGHLEGAAVATVRQLTDAQHNVPRSWWSEQRAVDISGGDESLGQPAQFDLPGGGLYGVSIARPRGKPIEREFFVAQDQDRSELIKLESSPHEYLGWQQYAGIVRSDPYRRETATQSAPQRSSGNAWFDGLIVQSQQRLDSLYDRAKSAPDVFRAQLPGTADDWKIVDAATRGAGEPWTFASPLSWPYQPDPEYHAWFPPMPDAGEGDTLVNRLRQPPTGPDPLEMKFPRWVTFRNGEEIDLMSVPWAWWGSSREPDEEIRFVYDAIRPSAVDRDSPGHAIVTVQDTRWFGLLEFIASGQLQQAGHIVNTVLPREDPETAMYGKRKGPLIAVAGAIVLIARAETNEPQPWDRWIANLSEWFGGIPDGAILYGYRRVQQATSMHDLKQAHELLRMGMSRGIPFFSACIRLLGLALAQIGEELPDADTDRRYIASVSTRVDPDQAFTVIRL